MKRYLNIIIYLSIFALLASFSANAITKTEYSFNSLKNCKNIYTSSNKSGAFVYGFRGSDLFVASVLPETKSNSITVNGVIRAVCQCNNLTYALYESYDRDKSYIVSSFDSASGIVQNYSFDSIKSINPKYFAVSDGEVYFRKTDSSYAYIEAYSLKGEFIRKYNFDKVVKDIFNNNSFAYAVLQDGQIFKLTQNECKYITEVSSKNTLCNAGIDYIYSTDNELISLKTGDNIHISGIPNNCIVMNKNGIIYSKDSTLNLKSGTSIKTYKLDKNIKAVLSYGDYIAALKDNYECEILSISDFEEYTSTINNDTTPVNKPSLFVNSDNIICGIESGTTVSEFKKSFDYPVKVYNTDGEEITSGKIKTGYKTDCYGGLKLVAVLGDVTGEGNVKSNDVTEFMKNITGEKSLNIANLVACDFNLDSNIDNIDLVLISRKSKE